MDTRKKLKNIIPLFLILYVCLSLFPYTGREPQDKTFLWQVKAEKNTSYILGSIHFLKKEMFPLDTRIENAFEESNILVGEVDLTSAKLAEGTMMLLKKGRYPRRETLKENLSQETYDKARSKFEELGMDIMQFNSFKPWMVALSISAFELVKLGFDPNWGVDKYFMDRASGKKKILEIEGLQYQIDLFESLSREEQENFLISILQDVSQYEEWMDKMVQIWKSGDSKGMEKLLMESVDEFPESKDIYKKLLDERNKKMAERIQEYLSTDDKYFIVVGAAHLVGNKGIIQLLKDKGYRVEQVISLN